MKYYEINENMAKQAKAMYSFSDYVINSETESYRKSVDEVYRIGQQAKERTSSEQHEYIDYLCEKYAKKYADYINKGFNIELQCPSVMICGGGNFPVRKKEKQNIARDNNMKYYNGGILSIIKKLQNMGTGTEIIKSSDPLAIERLQDKIDALTEEQCEMKKINAYYRKYKTMVGYENLKEDKALKLDENIKNTWDKKPFGTFELTNINQRIKSAKNRVNTLIAAKEKGTIEHENKYFKVVENTELMRLQLIFDEKPREEERIILKSHGFKWSPKNSAWQRQLTSNAKYSLSKVIEAIEKSNDKA